MREREREGRGILFCALRRCFVGKIKKEEEEKEKCGTHNLT